MSVIIVMQNKKWVLFSLSLGYSLLSLSYGSEANSFPPQKKYRLSRKTFCGLSRSTISKLKELNSEVFLKDNLGKLFVFLKFEEDLERTEEEWGQLYVVMVIK